MTRKTTKTIGKTMKTTYKDKVARRRRLALELGMPISTPLPILLAVQYERGLNGTKEA